jgi:glyceraldehyde 3-phosphate dehydrogenase
MAKIKIAINGFGRIGRLAFKILFENYLDQVEIVAINDLTSPDMLAHLLKYDSAQPRFNHNIESNDTSIIVDETEYTILAQSDANLLPWRDLGVDVVLECTGFYATRAKSMAHIKAGAKHVLINAPADDDVPTIVYGVNHLTLNANELIVSGSSCTTNCLAPVVDVLNKAYPIKKGTMLTVHSYTPDQNLTDGPHRKGDKRRARAAANNIVPNSTGAAKSIGLVIPSLKGVLDGSAMRVPTITGSVTCLYAIVEGTPTVEEINKLFADNANETLGYNEDEIVSTDIIGTTYGSLFDATLTKVTPLLDSHTYDKSLVSLFSWYDNESSYTNQYIRTAIYLASLLK